MTIYSPYAQISLMLDWDEDMLNYVSTFASLDRIVLFSNNIVPPIISYISKLLIFRKVITLTGVHSNWVSLHALMLLFPHFLYAMHKNACVSNLLFAKIPLEWIISLHFYIQRRLYPYLQIFCLSPLLQQDRSLTRWYLKFLDLALKNSLERG